MNDTQSDSDTIVQRTARMTRPQVQAAIEACHPCVLETEVSYTADESTSITTDMVEIKEHDVVALTVNLPETWKELLSTYAVEFVASNFAAKNTSLLKTALSS